MSSPPHPYIDPARARHLDGLAAELSRSEGRADVAIARSSPPEEVLEQMARADAVNTRLRERGFQVCFALSPDSSRLQIELRDTAGALLRRLTADEAVELAADGPRE